MSSRTSAVASVVPLRAAASSGVTGPLPAVVCEDGSEWRSLGGVAFAILADLDRRRPKLVVAPKSEPQSKAA